MSDRCFISVDIDDANIKSAIISVQNTLLSTGADLKPVEEANIHITLRFLGEIPESQTAQVMEIIKSVEFKAFKLGFHGVGVFPGLNRPNVVWVGVVGDMPEMLAVYTTMEKGLNKLGYEPERRGFQPHLTICRVRSGRNRVQLAESIRSIQDLDFGEMEVKSIRLKKSVLTRSGPIYSTVAESRSI